MNPEGPWKKAVKEARSVLVVSFLVAFGFNLFASNGVSWIREPIAIDTVSDADLLFDSVAADTVASIADTIDEEANQSDSAEEARARQAAIDSALRAEKDRRDSIERAQDARPADDNEPSSTVSVPTASAGEAKGITTRQAKKLFDQKSALFVDARRSDQFAEGHIPGAMNIYAYEFADHIGDVIDIPREKQIVVYCDGGMCEMSHHLAEELLQFGFKHVFIYTGGWEEWSATSYPKSSD